MHLSHIPQCTIQNRNVHISVLNGALCDMGQVHCGICKSGQLELEQVEHLRSEDTPRRLMITHTIESYWIPSQKKTKSKLQI